jgi:hypothetical protein
VATGGINSELKQKIQCLFKHRGKEDHSFEELESKQRHWPFLPGSYETGKHR